MEEVDKECLMIRMGVSGWMFLLVLAYADSPGPTAVKRPCMYVLILVPVYMPAHCYDAVFRRMRKTSCGAFTRLQAVGWTRAAWQRAAGWPSPAWVPSRRYQQSRWVCWETPLRRRRPTSARSSCMTSASTRLILPTKSSLPTWEIPSL